MPNMPPPSIAHLKGHGLEGVFVTCAGCSHLASIPFEKLDLPDGTSFPDIARLRKFRCVDCGGRRVTIMPDWRKHKAAGT
jgi:DNA-directed RNA polymerase subunit RPC12/RpoP